jgi:signal transduction histidine kinase
MRRGGKPAKAKVEAKVPVSRKSLKNESSRVHPLQKRLAEALKREADALEQQTATSEILRVISSSPTDVQPVFEAVLASAARLCDALDATMFRVDGDVLRLVAHEGPIPSDPVGTPRELTPATPSGRAVLEGRTIQVADIQADVGEYPEGSAFGRALSFRTVLSVPLLRRGDAIGAIAIRRTEVRPFTDRQTELLQTFADQAVIAIENVRLFTELDEKNQALIEAHAQVTEALEQQTATSEILRVISRSPTEIHPVFDTIAESAIIGFSEILAEKMFGDINEKQTEYLQDILESGRHLLSLINDILDLSKIEAGRLELELSEFDLPQAIENALILVRERASRRGIRLGSTIDPGLATIGGDERKVKQVLLNLLSNALKFTPEGGRIDVGARLHDHVAEVSVTDTGIGIEPADQEAVFEEFRQVGTADKKAEGTGLGLALSRKFIELHGGRIWVQSELGAGSTFTFTLPLGR